MFDFYFDQSNTYFEKSLILNNFIFERCSTLVYLLGVFVKIKNTD